MKSILEQLFNSNIYPDELIIPKNLEYHPLNQKISSIIHIWRSKLSPDDFAELEVLLDLRSKADSMYAEASFVYGFKLGAAILIEVLTGKGELTRNGD